MTKIYKYKNLHLKKLDIFYQKLQFTYPESTDLIECGSSSDPDLDPKHWFIRNRNKFGLGTELFLPAYHALC